MNIFKMAKEKLNQSGDEFELASKLERYVTHQFVNCDKNDLIGRYQFSNEKGYDNYDLKFLDNKGNRCVGEVKVRYTTYDNGWYLEKQKYDSMVERFPNCELYYCVFSPSGLYIYNLSNVFHFNKIGTGKSDIKLSEEMLPKTSAKKSKLVKKEVYTLPLKEADYYSVYFDEGTNKLLLEQPTEEEAIAKILKNLR